MTVIRAVLFDLDGVLVDAREWHWAALNQALGLFGYVIGRDEHLNIFDGLPTRKKMAYLATHRGFPKKLVPIVGRLKQQYTKQLIAINCFPVFHIEYMLKKLKQDGYKLAVCSNSIRETLDLMLIRSALTNYFDVILSNEDCKDRPKPEPEIYLTAMEMLGVAPEESLIVEDNEHGIQAAKRSGGLVMGVCDPSEVHYHTIMQRIADVKEAE